MEASKTNPNFTMTTCAACTMTTDTDEGMVCCDGCDKWYHYRCVGVEEKDIQKRDKWFCPTEECQKIESEMAKKLEENRKKGSRSKKTLVVDDASDKSSCRSERTSVSSFEKKMKALEKEQRAKEKDIEEERRLWEKRIEMERILKEKRMQMETEMRRREMEQEKALLEKSLREEQEHQHQMERMRNRYKEKMTEIKRVSKKPEPAEDEKKPKGKCAKVDESSDSEEESDQESEKEDEEETEEESNEDEKK